jgi:hypothetical protein
MTECHQTARVSTQGWTTAEVEGWRLAINRSFLSTKKKRKKGEEFEIHYEAYNQAINSSSNLKDQKYSHSTKSYFHIIKPITQPPLKQPKIHNSSHHKPNRITTLSKSTKPIGNLHKASHSSIHFQKKVVFHFLDPGLTLTLSKKLSLSCSTSALISRAWACLARPQL